MTVENPVIKCESVFKIFGANPEKMLESNKSNVNPKIFQEAGYIVGVNNASFEVSKGEILVVMGLSGSGKSTLIRHINRLIEPTSGHIFVDGEDVLTLDDDQLRDLRRQKISMVFQRFGLFPHKTVIQNIAKRKLSGELNV